MSLRVIVDRAACCGYGVCAEICPDVFGLDENGIVKVAAQSVPAAQQDLAREACAACPQSAIALEEVG